MTSMTVGRVRWALASITYKPCFPLRRPHIKAGFSGGWRSSDPDTLRLEFGYEAPDRDRPDTIVFIGNRVDVLMAFIRDEADLVEFIWRKWRELAMHEVDEGFSVHGKLPFDPHTKD